jgi:hypothetical protein
MKKVLADLRYPKLNQLEKTFEKKRKGLSLPSNISLHHPLFFEGKRLEIKFQFETTEEYRSTVSSLSLLADKKEFGEMLEDKHQNTSTH